MTKKSAAARARTTCPECGAQMTETVTAMPFGLVGDWSVLVEDAVVARCSTCGYFEVGFDRPAAIIRAVVSAVLNKPSRLSPQEIRFLRGQLELDSQTLARRLGTSPGTMSRWENGRLPISEPAERLLRALVALSQRNAADFDPSVLERIDHKEGQPLRLAMRRDARGEWHRVAA